MPLSRRVAALARLDGMVHDVGDSQNEACVDAQEPGPPAASRPVRGLSMGVAPNLGFDFEIYLPCMHAKIEVACDTPRDQRSHEACVQRQVKLGGYSADEHHQGGYKDAVRKPKSRDLLYSIIFFITRTTACAGRNRGQKLTAWHARRPGGARTRSRRTASGA